MNTPALESMSCAEAEPLLPLVADGALTATDDRALFDHLATCEACQEALARHDLISLALTAPGPAPAVRRPRIIRNGWWLAVPVAAAAGLTLTVALAPMSPSATTPASTPVTAQVTPPVATDPAPVVIERDVASLPGNVPGKKLILVRRGDQVLLVDPAAPADSGRTDATPASIRY